MVASSCHRCFSPWPLAPLQLARLDAHHYQARAKLQLLEHRRDGFLAGFDNGHTIICTRTILTDAQTNRLLCQIVSVAMLASSCISQITLKKVEEPRGGETELATTWLSTSRCMATPSPSPCSEAETAVAWLSTPRSCSTPAPWWEIDAAASTSSTSSSSSGSREVEDTSAMNIYE
ncbi:Methionine--tRNA ligase [Frankliniella fusca]|uniref:Methionine--tRNA ligase n=1 Tax=Frankliniella fusca TaxID=407009 RepID=A0AAE1HIL1_9NEOP|nr:Methionine--tRNA ligase [Frankliniella fusca]